MDLNDIRKYKYSILGTLLFVYALFLIFLGSGYPTLYSYGWIVYVFLSLLAFLSLIRVYRSLDKSFCDERNMWFWLAVAFLLKFFGEVFWWFYEEILHIDVPSLSLADVAWHAGYVVIIVALFYKIKQMFFENKTRAFAVLLIIWALISGLYLFSEMSGIVAIHTTVTLNDLGSVADHLVNTLYVVEDLIVIALVIFISRVSFTNYSRVMNPLIFLTFAFTFALVYDYFFAELVLRNVYQTGNVIDLFYDLSYLFVIFAASSKYRPNVGKVKK